MPSLAHDTVNDTRKDDFDTKVSELGKLHAKGTDALAMLAIAVAYAAADGVISGDKDTNGDDDYVRAYTRYNKAREKHEVHEHTAGGFKAQVSKLRQIGTASTMTTCDFKTSLQLALDKRTELLGDKQKVKAAYPMLVSLARTQLDQPDDVTADQIEEAARKAEADEKTLEGEIKRMHGIADALIEGKKGVSCTDQWLVDIHAVLASQLSAFQIRRETEETLAAAARLGISLAPAPMEIESDSPAQGYVA